MRVVITGATGFIGSALCRELHKQYEVVALSRDPTKAQQSIGPLTTIVQWDAKTLDAWEKTVDGALAVINLAGENIASGRWNHATKNRILHSRLNAAEAIVKAVKHVEHKPGIVIQASATGYYGSRGDQILDESSSGGTGFLADVCKQWEQAIRPLEDLPVRLLIIRLGPVLGAEGGMIPKLLPAFRFFLGGHPGHGSQYLSWIHIDDVTAAVRFLLETAASQGLFNLTAPTPVPAKDFYNLLAKTLHRPAVFPLPASMLKLLMGQMADELLLSSQRVMPAKLLLAGYKFRYVDPKSAIESIIGKHDNLRSD
ncbi:MAG TPA: TIGR01777 family oxidoreductase [Sedimentisphaerales bacterium]|nr:TIGR01777 family oxidoreductase [Sedimentisphaerales bacterium]